MAPFSALRNSWQPLLHPYRTHDLCPQNLYPRCVVKNENLNRSQPMDSLAAPARAAGRVDFCVQNLCLLSPDFQTPSLD